MQARKTLGQLKIAMTSIPSLFGAPTDSSSPANFAQETQIVLDAFELGAFLSLKVGDMNSFERHIAQAKTIYFDYKLVIPDPKNQAVLTGLHLMHLLSQTRIAEFHTALETVSPSLQSHPCIQASPLTLFFSPFLASPYPFFTQFPVSLEQYLMEGAYHKILQSRASIPSPQFQVFLDMLVSTVRDAIAVRLPLKVRSNISSPVYSLFISPAGLRRGCLRRA
jgi:26S proteasome regulatory subunit N12